MTITNINTGEIVADIIGGKNLTIEEVLELVGYVRFADTLDADTDPQMDDPDYIHPVTGKEIWVEELN